MSELSHQGRARPNTRERTTTTGVRGRNLRSPVLVSPRQSSLGLHPSELTKEKKTTPSMASSSRRSVDSRRARTRNYDVDSPEFLQGQLRQLQAETASDIRLRTMARIGELYLDQSSSSSVDERNSDEPFEVDGGIDTSDQEEESHPQPQMPYYHGFNSPPGVHDILSDRENRNELEMCGTVSGAWTMRNDAVAPLVDARSSAWTMQNGSGAPLSHSVLRKNLTSRKSLPRPRDRDSIGTTSVPVDLLVSRKVKPREKDLEYNQEVLGGSTTPREPRGRDRATPMSQGHARPRATPMSQGDARPSTPSFPPVSLKVVRDLGVGYSMVPG